MIQLTCPRHRKQVLFVNVDENVKIGLRTACDDCGLKTPISVNKALELFEEILKIESEQALDSEKKEVQILLELKNRLSTLKKKVVQRLDDCLLSLDKSISEIRTQFKNLIYKLPEEISLTEMQSIAYKISQKNNEHNQFQTNLKKVLDNRITILIEICEKVTQITEEFRDLRRYQPLQAIPQDLCLDSAFIPNSDYLVATNQNSINYYQCKAGNWKLIKEIKDAHRRIIESISINQEYIVSGGRDKTVRLYNGKMEQIYQLEGHLDFINTTAISQKYDEIYSAGNDRTILVWTKQGQVWNLGQRLSLHSREILSISLSQSQDLLISGGWDKSLILWERNNSWKEKQVIEKAHKDEIYSVCFISDNMFASGSKQLKTWCYNSAYGIFEQHRVISTQEKTILRIKTQNNILISSNEDQVQVWRVNKGLELLFAIQGFYVGISLSEDSKYIAMYNYDKKQLEIRELI